MARSYLPPVEFLRECFSYDPDTGGFCWKFRPRPHFPDDVTWMGWNIRYSGAQAFTTRDREGYGRSEFRYQGKRIRTRSARVAFKLMTGEEPDQIDHINGDETDDRWANLRAATPADNARNKIGAAGKRLPKGVFYEKGRFTARCYNKARIKECIGTFDAPAEAHAAYCEFARTIHGEFFNPGPSRPTIFD